VGEPVGFAQLSRVRTIPHHLGEPIADRLLPDDDVVVVEREFDEVSSPIDNLTDIIEGTGAPRQMLVKVGFARA
jgi:hypothetical protein